MDEKARELVEPFQAGYKRETIVNEMLTADAIGLEHRVSRSRKAA